MESAFVSWLDGTPASSHTFFFHSVGLSRIWRVHSCAGVHYNFALSMDYFVRTQSPLLHVGLLSSYGVDGILPSMGAAKRESLSQKAWSASFCGGHVQMPLRRL